MTAVDDRPAISPEIGKDRRRKEDQRLITGRTRWTDNIALPGMLHLAMVRSPHAHAKILSIDIEAADKSLNIYEVFTGKHLAETQGVVVNAWPITTEQKAPDHLPMAVDRVAFAGEIVAVVAARTAAEARDAAELVDVEYEVLPAVLDLKEAAEDKVLAHPDLGTNKVAFWQLDSAGQGTGTRDRRGHRRGSGRRHRHRARVPPAAADPGVHGAAVGRRRPDRRADHHVVGDPDPAHHPVPARRHDRRTRVEDPRDRPRRRRRVRRQAADHSRGVDHLGDGAQDRQALQVHRDPLGVPGLGPPRPRPVAEAHAGRHQGGQGHRPEGRPARRHGRLRRRGRRRRTRPRRVDVQRDLQVRRLPVQLHAGADEQDVGRRLPRRRPSRGDVRHRAADGRARRRGGQGPARGPGDELDQARGVPVHHGRGHDLRLRQLRGGHRQGQGDVRVRRVARRAEGAARPRGQGAARHRHLDLHRDVRAGAVPGARVAQLRRRRLGARHRPDAADRQGRGDHRHERPRPGPRDGLQPDRRRPAGSAVRGRRDPARRHPGLPQGPGHLRLAVARGGRRGAGAGGRQGHREGQAARGPPARGQRRRPRVQQRPLHRPGHRPGHAASPRSRWRRSRRTTTRRAWSRASTRSRPTTR